MSSTTNTASAVLTQEEIEQIEQDSPLDISLFIGGREIQFRAPSHQLSKDNILATLHEEADNLRRTIEESIEEEARYRDMSIEEARLELGAQLLYINRLIQTIAQ